MFRDKQTTNKVPLMLLDACIVINNCIIGVSQKTSKVQCMYLAFKKLRTSSKNGLQLSKS